MAAASEKIAARVCYNLFYPRNGNFFGVAGLSAPTNNTLPLGSTAQCRLIVQGNVFLVSATIPAARATFSLKYNSQKQLLHFNQN